jgi:Glycosyl transferase family 2
VGESGPQPRTLTIGIPTFNRREVVSERVSGLIAAKAFERADILVVDDASPDDSYGALVTLCEGTPIRVLRNDGNLGYAGNFVRLFQECATPYLGVATDDDTVIPEQLAPLTELLEGQAPLFVSTQFYRSGRLYRGQRVIREIRPKEFGVASAHAPGLVYQAPVCLKIAIPKLIERLALGSAAAHIYPQTIITCLLLVTGRCLWWNRPIVAVGEEAPSGVRDPSGAPYWDLAPRWRQIQDLLSFLDDPELRCPDGHAREAMIQSLQDDLFRTIRGAIEIERPDLIASFDEGAHHFYARRLQRLWRHLRRHATDPKAAAAAVGHRLHRS